MSNEAETRRPLFTDLFYAAVIGFAVSKIEAGNDIRYYVFSMIGLAFVVEDWFSYYTRVLKDIVDIKRYDLYNIFVEFSILISWSICFSGIIGNNEQFFIFFGFFISKIIIKMILC